MKRLKHILVFVIVFLVLWEIVLRSFSMPKTFITNVFERNVDRGETIMFDDFKKYKYFLAGSSTTADFKMDVFDDSSCNFSVEGGASITPLTYLLDNKIYPEIILVETNSVCRSKDEKLLNSLSNPLKNFLRINFKSFRMVNKPSRYISYSIDKVIDYFNLKVLNLNLNTAYSFHQTLFDTILEGHIKNHNNLKDTSIVRKNIEHMIDVADEIQNFGSKVIFFEIPYDFEINNAKMPLYIDQLIKENIKSSRIKYFSVERKKKFNTADGVHLTDMEREKYMLSLKDYVDSTLNIK